MTCATRSPTYRLLDPLAGWEAASADGLDLEPDGLRLALAVGAPGGIPRHRLLPWFPPPRLAPGCGPCAWYLATPVPPAARMLRREPCADAWLALWPAACQPVPLVEPTAVAARRHSLAVADGGTGRVLVFAAEGDQLVASFEVDAASALALTAWGEVLVARPGTSELLRFGPDGAPRGGLHTGVDGEVEGIAAGRACTLWLLTRDDRGRFLVWRGHRDEPSFRPATLAELADAVPASSLTAVSERGFCLTERGPEGGPVARCFTWYGRPLDPGSVGAPAPPQRVGQGQLLTLPVDSGLPRCRWHRVRIEAEVPAATSLEVAVSTSEVADPPVQGDPGAEDPAWAGFPAGVPHPVDWQQARPGTLDLLVDRPPGRYLFVRLRLTGGAATALVRRVRLDFPRVTSADHLPAVYRQTPQTEDFTERFLSLFDASLEELDRHIDRHPALLDAAGVPDEVLPWLGDLLGLAFDPAWDAARRRRLLDAVPELYRRRGTVEGLRMAVELVFDVTPVIAESALARAWGALGRDGRVGSVRLFGRAAARFRLGGSALSRTPLRSFGNPDDDPVTAHAYRFGVLVPPTGGAGPDLPALRRLVASQAPAHTVPAVRVGGTGLVVGTWSAVGVDTALVPLPAPVLGGRERHAGAARLNRASVLWHGRKGRRPGIRVGDRAAVGIHTVAE